VKDLYHYLVDDSHVLLRCEELCCGFATAGPTKEWLIAGPWLRFFCQIGEVGVRILLRDLILRRLKSYKWKAENIVKNIGVRAEEMGV
jgi:hypothetical protein